MFGEGKAEVRVFCVIPADAQTDLEDVAVKVFNLSFPEVVWKVGSQS